VIAAIPAVVAAVIAAVIAVAVVITVMPSPRRRIPTFVAGERRAKVPRQHRDAEKQREKPAHPHVYSPVDRILGACPLLLA
jgi:hypothetical protein